MDNQTFKTKVGHYEVVVSEVLRGFDLHKKASTNVDYFATNAKLGILFIQFNNGACFLYDGVPPSVLEDAVLADSIGKFYYAAIKGKYHDRKIADRCVRPDDEEEEGNDQYDPFENNYDEGFDSLDKV